MRIPLLSGIYVDQGPDFRSAYPVNMVPVPKVSGIAEGYLRPAEGIVSSGTHPGEMRGGAEWKGVLYRVMGAEFVSIDVNGNVVVIGSIGGTGRVRMSYGFEYLSIASAGQLWLYNGTTLARITDPDLGVCVDAIWADGYYVSTDGEFIVVTELNDPFAVDPLKYGSAESDPDPIIALHRIRNEVYALNRNTIEVFSNTGGTGFPFERIPGAQIEKGAVGTHAACVFMGTLAFIGSGYNEAPSVYIAGNGTAQKIATREIDVVLAGYTEEQLAQAVVAGMVSSGHERLVVMLPNKTLVYDAAASSALEQPVWYCLSTSLNGAAAWSGFDLIWCYNRWNVGRVGTGQFGYLTDDISTHWGDTIGWEITTPIVYNDGRGMIIHDLELVALTGQGGPNPLVSTSYSVDGVTWSQPKWVSAGKPGQRTNRILWLQQGSVRHWRIQRFRGTSDTHISPIRLEARVEPLAF